MYNLTTINSQVVRVAQSIQGLPSDQLNPENKSYHWFILFKGSLFF